MPRTRTTARWDYLFLGSLAGLIFEVASRRTERKPQPRQGKSRLILRPVRGGGIEFKTSATAKRFCPL
jgi:hypothetical protein